jgi:hypothetical protein
VLAVAAPGPGWEQSACAIHTRHTSLISAYTPQLYKAVSREWAAPAHVGLAGVVAD